MRCEPTMDRNDPSYARSAQLPGSDELYLASSLSNTDTILVFRCPRIRKLLCQRTLQERVRLHLELVAWAHRHMQC